MHAGHGPRRPGGLRGGRRSRADLKWPNDLVVGERKLAGILAEAIPDAPGPGTGPPGPGAWWWGWG